MAETQGQGTSTLPNDSINPISVDASPRHVAPVHAHTPATPAADAVPSAGAAPSTIPDPKGTSPAEIGRERLNNPDPTLGIGTEGELDVWEGSYSIRNFFGRMIAVVILGMIWIGLAVYVWGYDHRGMNVIAIIAGIALALWAVSLGLTMLRAHMGHHYRLTTRRLFVSTGIMNRERDQLELLRVQDVFTRQDSLLERIFHIGTVIVVSDQKNMPNYSIPGVAEPRRVHDLIWHHARAEQDQRSVRVDQI